jgi:hypothetical protein
MPKAGATHIPVHFGGEMGWYAVRRLESHLVLSLMFRVMLSTLFAFSPTRRLMLDLSRQ